ncbi:glutathione S-transferase family protein [Saccharophagus degradans]|uniref:Glutathione S-transferase family protein n=1 Tax=Saccharophagus degradans TaxID=86304 RepID=A0AAW7X4F1_9GAMM|nr:glutathione S-transferase family protein [Saccharophagus degradans]MDO6421423.1 glutathione S-transferase family protein [Saccharophagus degradans]MDO6608763.1 glutathione S-transferase family protein [Saccharophagus degradans]
MSHANCSTINIYSSTTSPFARKANMVVQLTGLGEHTQIIYTNPFEDASLREINPLGKVPALKHDELLLTDSYLICEYLDDKAANLNLYRKGQADYYQVQQVHMLCNGILEAAVATVMEKRRTTEHSTYWLERWDASISTALNILDVNQLGTADHPHIGTVALIAALGYLDFRHPERNWREHYPAIANWYSNFENLHWVASTTPKA